MVNPVGGNILTRACVGTQKFAVQTAKTVWGDVKSLVTGKIDGNSPIEGTACKVRLTALARLASTASVIAGAIGIAFAAAAITAALVASGAAALPVLPLLILAASVAAFVIGHEIYVVASNKLLQQNGDNIDTFAGTWIGKILCRKKEKEKVDGPSSPWHSPTSSPDNSPRRLAGDL